MSKYYKINSRLKSSIGLDYLIDNKKGDGKVAVKVTFAGAQRPGDIEKNLIPPTYIDKLTYASLKKYTGGKVSKFSLLINEGQLSPQECGFNDLPSKIQQKFDPALYDKLEVLRKNQELKALAALEKEQEE